MFAGTAWRAEKTAISPGSRMVSGMMAVKFSALELSSALTEKTLSARTPRVSKLLFIGSLPTCVLT